MTMRHIFTLFFSAFLVSLPELFAANQIVTSNANSGSGSLRQAIIDVTDGGQITFNLSAGNETITLSSELSITAKGITIDGANTLGSGVSITVQVSTPGSSTWRVFNLAPGADKSVTLQNLTLKGGDISGSSGYGGVVSISSGTCTIADCTVRDGKAQYGGGIYLNGSGVTTTLQHCTITNNSAYSGSADARGGGIYNNSGTIIISQCEIYSNSVLPSLYTEFGGGLFLNYGYPTISNSAIYSNNGGIQGGGVYAYYGTHVVTNCTISNNSCSSYGGGLSFSYSPSITLTNCTIAENSASFNNGIYVGTTTGIGVYIYMMNCLLAMNGTGSFYDFINMGAGDVHMTDNGYNLVENSYGYAFSATGDITGNQTNLDLAMIPALNNSLYGTSSLKLTSGSVAINAGATGSNNGVGVPTEDQRGALRNGSVDMGSYEWWSDGGALPVQLIAFTAKLKNRIVELNWQTVTEKSNYGFDIERRRGSASDVFLPWEKIGFVAGNGTVNTPQFYAYCDDFPTNAATVLYRLKQIDRDGSSAYSDEVEVSTSIQGFQLAQNYPNPFCGSTTITFTLPRAGDVTLKVYDVMGNEILTLVKDYREAGMYNIRLNTAQIDLKPGLYTYQLRTGTNVQSRTMMYIK